MSAPPDVLKPTPEPDPEQVAAERADKIAGIRLFVDWLEQHPEVELPVSLTDISQYVFTRHELATIAKALGKASKSPSDDYFGVERTFGEISYRAFTERDKVCRAVVVGTELVPEEVRPAYERKIVEWQCDDPLLSSLPAQPAGVDS